MARRPRRPSSERPAIRGIPADDVEIVDSYSGTVTVADGTSHYVIDQMTEDGEFYRLLDVKPDKRKLPARATEADWRAEAEDLKGLLREIWPAVRRDRYNGWEPHMSEALLVVPHISQGSFAVLADIAEHFVMLWIDGQDTSNWETLDAAIDEAVPWAPLAKDRWDTHRIGKLIKAGWLQPDPAALADLRDRERTDEADEAETAGFSGELVTFQSETQDDAAVRAARELRLPIDLIVWAHHGQSFGAPLLVGDQVWARGRDALLIFDAHTGAPVGTDESAHFDRVHGLWHAEGVILVDTTGIVSAVDPDTRELMWSVPASEGIRIDPTRAMIRNGGLRVADPTSITCVELASGHVLWKIDGTGDRPGLQPVGFAGGFCWVIRRDGWDYHLEALDRSGTKVDEWACSDSHGEIIGDHVVISEAHRTWQELLEGQTRWSGGAAPVFEHEEVTIWRKRQRADDWLVGAGTAKRARWLAPSPIHVGGPYDGPAPPWAHCAGRLWYGHGQGSLLGVGPDKDDFVHISLPGYLWGEVSTTRDDHLVLAATGASGGHSLACLDPAALEQYS